MFHNTPASYHSNGYNAQVCYACEIVDDPDKLNYPRHDYPPLARCSMDCYT
jgi:hypothetical protein